MVPRLATFAVDQGFWYSIPNHLAGEVRVGSIVRVPLSGRRVRGYVTELGDPEDRVLKPIASVSGDEPVFDERLLRTLSWGSQHYVAPLSVMLDRTSPPNLPTSLPAGEELEIEAVDGILSPLAAAAVAGQRRPVSAFSGRLGPTDWVPSVGPVLVAGKTVAVVVATAKEASEIHEVAKQAFGSRALAVFGDVDREITEAWARARAPGHFLVGTPRIAAWHLPGLALAVVLEEGRRAMKDRQTPTVHVREILTHRAKVEGFVVAFVGPTPSLELLAAGAEVNRVGSRAWSLVEIVDRSGDPPGSGFLSSDTIAALRAVSGRGGRSLVFTHRRAGDSALRCSNCRSVRSCGACGARLGREEECRRCHTPAGPCANCGGQQFESMGTVPDRLVDAITRSIGAGSAGTEPTRLPIAVGTERDLPGLGTFDLVVVADADGLMLGHDFRAGEEALRIIARLGNAVAPGSGRRLMIQTSMPDADLITTLRSGNPIPFLERELARRATDAMPPAIEMLALELRGLEDPKGVNDSLSVPGVSAVLGPAVSGQGFRWLLQGDLRLARQKLRSLAQTWRDRGVAVRVDADPIDL